MFAGQQRIIRLRNPIFWLLIIGSLIHTCLAWKACLIEGHTYYLKNVLNMLLIADCWALVMFMELLVAVGSPDDVMVNIGAVVVVLAASPVVDMTWMLKLTSTLLSLLLALLWLFSTVKIENIEFLKILIWLPSDLRRLLLWWITFWAISLVLSFLIPKREMTLNIIIIRR